MKIAVIDCGTNTFKLLIVKIIKERWFLVYQSTLGVKLTSGVTSNGLASDRMARGLDVLKTFQENIINFEADETHAFATSAIRSAKNGKKYVEAIKQKIGIDIQVINGNREAELIFKGVKQSFDLTEEPILIMDIGGGSTEFIIANNEGVKWKQSYQLGSSRLKNMFEPSSPMTEENRVALELYFEETLPSLFEQIKLYQPHVLLGNSGSFNSLIQMINLNFKDLTLKDRNNEIPLPVFNEIHEKLCLKTLEEKLQVVGLDTLRAEIITLATILISFVLKKSGIKKLVQTSYALKEGVVGEILER